MNLKCFLIVVFFSFTVSSNTIANDAVEKEKKLLSLQTKIKQFTKDINDLKSQKSTLLTELKKLDIQFGKSAVQLSNLEEKVKKLNNVLQSNRKQMHVKQQEINAQKSELKDLVKAAYGMGRNKKIKLLLNQQDLNLSERMLSYYDYINKARIKKIAEIEIVYLSLRDLEEKQLKETVRLEKIIEKRTLERSVLKKTKSKRNALLVKINKQVVSKNKQLIQYKASEKRLKTLLESLQKAIDDFPLEEGVVKAFVNLKGKLPWPVKGKIVKKFGAKRSDSRWDGVLIKAKEGVEIRAVTRGRVVYADWLRGYGLLTIIDHGKGYMTLYAFNQSLYKTVGEWVEAGIVIATVGRSGGQAGSGLYFGIRKKGKPVNPVRWCRRF